MSTTPSTRKRTHLKPSQVTTLQESFNVNPLPDSSVRSQLAQDLGVTERTIQIWFQNRRAKARKIDLPESTATEARPNTLTGGAWLDRQQRHVTPPRYQATFRTMMTPERFEELKEGGSQQPMKKRPRSCSKPEPNSSLLIESFHNSRAMSEGVHQKQAQLPSNKTIATTSIATGAAVTHHRHQHQATTMLPLFVNVLRIGSWTRFAHASAHTNQKEWDLVCYCNPTDREFIWRVQAEGHHFRIQVSFDSISLFRLSQQIQIETGDIVGQLDIETGALVFSMWRFGQDHQWVRCGDFTEDKQATVDPLHVLQGNHEVFKQALLDLIALAPDLANKIQVLPVDPLTPPSLDLCRDFTMSPSATPEPSTLIAAANAAAAAVSAATTHPTYLTPYYGMMNPQHLSNKMTNNNMSHLMLQAPFFCPTTSNVATMTTNQQHPPPPTNEELYQMQQYMLQQQQQQQQMMYNTHSAAAAAAPNLM